MKTQRLTMAQALIRYLKNQYVERDGWAQPFFAGCFGTLGHGNVAGIGQALQENLDFTFYQSRNEQAMVHTATGFARMKNRMQTFALTTSIGPGATNLVTGAAQATINRLPVLLLPADVFARRSVQPVLQQLECEHTQDISVNDCLKPVSRYWDRINRPEQLLASLPEMMRVLTSPSDTGAVTLALPQDVQTEAYEYPVELFEQRTWLVPRLRPDLTSLKKAADWIGESKAPIIIAGGGVRYSGAAEVLESFASKTGIPVVETQAGKGTMHYQHKLALGSVGVSGSRGANLLAADADLVIGVGTRYGDFTTASRTLFQNDNVRFININVSGLDSHKHNALSLVADARVALEELSELLKLEQTSAEYRQAVSDYKSAWEREVDSIYRTGLTCEQAEGKEPEESARLSQSEVIGLLNGLIDERDVVVGAAGSLPDDLHRLWRCRNSESYHVEHGYSCTGYEIAGGLGAKMAEPDRQVYVLVGDGSYLTMAQEIITSVQEGVKINIVLINNHGFAGTGALSESLGSDGFGTEFRYRGDDGQLSGKVLPVNLFANARSMGAYVTTAKTRSEFETAFKEIKEQDRTSVILVVTDTDKKAGCYEAWWDVPVAETSEMESVRSARKEYESGREKQKSYYRPSEGQKVLQEA